MDLSDIKKSIQDSIAVKQGLLKDRDLLGRLSKASEIICNQLSSGNKLLIAGNGGSAADAQHFSAEITGRFVKERKGYPAIAFNTDSSFLTAWANDYAFDTVFARLVEAYGKKGDVFVGISTSGNSYNVVNAVNQAKEMGIKTICFLGKKGGILKDLTDVSLVVPYDITARVQESHIMFVHIICEYLDKKLK